MSLPAGSLPPAQPPPGPPPQGPSQGPPGLPAAIAAALADQGWCITDAFLPPLLVSQLRHEAAQRWQDGRFRRAGVGRGSGLELRPEVRTDRILWLHPAGLTGAQRALWQRLEAVRSAVNRLMYLGLHELEVHVAVYPPGAYYRKHLDRFHDQPGTGGRRELSCVLYLNDAWQPQDGGALRIYTGDEDAKPCAEALPIGGRLVTFLSARFPHEVLPARRERFSITGWFRSR